MDGNLSSYLLTNFSEEFCSSSRTLYNVPEVICRQSCTLMSQESSEVRRPTKRSDKFALPSSVSQTGSVFPLSYVSETNNSFVSYDKSENFASSGNILPLSVAKEKTSEGSRAGRASDEKVIDSFTFLDEQILERSCPSSFGGRMGLSSSYLGAEIPDDLTTVCVSPTKAGSFSHSLQDGEASVPTIDRQALLHKTSHYSSLNSANLKKQGVPVSSSELRESNSCASTTGVRRHNVQMSGSEVRDPELGKETFLARKDKQKMDAKAREDNDREEGRVCEGLLSFDMENNTKQEQNCKESLSSPSTDMKVPSVVEKRHESCDEKNVVDDKINSLSSGESRGKFFTHNSGVELSKKIISQKMSSSNIKTQSPHNRVCIPEVQFLPKKICSSKHETEECKEETYGERCRRAASLSDVAPMEFLSNEIVQESQSVPTETVVLRLSQTEFSSGPECDLSIFINKNSRHTKPEKVYVSADNEMNTCDQKIQMRKHTHAQNIDREETDLTEDEELHKKVLNEVQEPHLINTRTECEENHSNIPAETEMQGNIRTDDEPRDFEDDPYPSIVSSDSGVFAPICGSDKDDIFPHRSSVEVSSYSECEEFESLQSELLSSLTETNDVFTFSFNSPLSGKIFRDDMGTFQDAEISSPFCTDKSTDEECIDVAHQDNDNLNNFDESFDTSFTEKVLSKISLLQKTENVIDSLATTKLVGKTKSSLTCSQSDSRSEKFDECTRDNSILQFSKLASKHCTSSCSSEKIKKQSSNCRHEKSCAKSNIVSQSRDRISIDKYPSVAEGAKLEKSDGISTLALSNAMCKQSDDTSTVAAKNCFGNRSELDALELSEDLKNAIWRAMEKEEEIRERRARGINEDKSDEEMEKSSEICRKKLSTITQNETNLKIVGRKTEDFKKSCCNPEKNIKIKTEAKQDHLDDKHMFGNLNGVQLSPRDKKICETAQKSQTQPVTSPGSDMKQRSLHADRINSLFALKRQLNSRKKIRVDSTADSSSLLADYLRIQLRISSLLSEVKTISKEARNSINDFSSLQTRTNNISEERDDLLRLRDSILNV